MSSRIEQLIDEIEEYIDGCKFQPLSNTKNTSLFQTAKLLSTRKK